MMGTIIPRSAPASRGPWTPPAELAGTEPPPSLDEAQGDDPAPAAATATVEELEGMTQAQLKDWLKERGAAVTGTKTALFVRAKEVLAGTYATKKAPAKRKAAGGSGDGAKKAKKADEWPPGPIYDASMRKPAPAGPAFKVMSWNVAGLNALLSKEPGLLRALAERESPDVLCLQEHKLQEGKVEEFEARLREQLPGYESFEWSCSGPPANKGYSGVVTISKVRPLSVTRGLPGVADADDPEVNHEGRVVVTEHAGVYVLNAYVPNAAKGGKDGALGRLALRTDVWDPAMAAAVRGLEGEKPVVVAGDLNCAREEIDIHNPKGNLKSAGFTPEERASFAEQYMGNGMVDPFREQHPGVVGYTYYGYRFNMRAKGKGWRLDYTLCSASLRDRCHDAFLLPDVMGSDHVPVGLTLTM